MSAVAPRDLKDLIDPEWKGKMAITEHDDRRTLMAMC